MVDQTDEQIKKDRQAAIEIIKEKMGVNDVEVLDSFFEGAPHDAKPLWFLGKSIQVLSNADLAYFIGEWRKYRGCKAEHYLAEAYGIKIIEE